MSLLALITSVVFIGARFWPRDGGQGATTTLTISTTTISGTTQTTLPPEPAPLNPSLITAGASSVLADDGDITYAASNTLDGIVTTAWNHGNDATEGEGETLTYEFENPVHLVRIDVINGYDKPPNRFAQNSRLKDVTITTETGEVFSTTLEDMVDWQSIDHDFGVISTVTIEVLSVYLGSGEPFVGRDLALSEIVFLVVP